MSSTPYQFVIPATQENIDVRLGSIGLPRLSQLTDIQKLFLKLFISPPGQCLCVRETNSGLSIKTLLPKKKP